MDRWACTYFPASKRCIVGCPRLRGAWFCSGLLLGDRCKSRWYWHRFYAMWSPFGLHQQAPWPQNTRPINRSMKRNTWQSSLPSNNGAFTCNIPSLSSTRFRKVWFTSTSSAFTPIGNRKSLLRFLVFAIALSTKKGCDNRVVHALSHRSHDQLHCLVVSSNTP